MDTQTGTTQTAPRTLAAGTPAPKPGKKNVAGPNSGLADAAITARAREMANREMEKLDKAKAAKAAKAELDAIKARKAQAKAKADADKQDAKAQAKIERDALRELRNAPVPESFTDVGTRTIELVRIFESSGVSYQAAITQAEEGAKAATIAAFPSIEPDFLVAKTVSDKLGKLSYRVFVRVTYVNPLIPGWSGIKAKSE